MVRDICLELGRFPGIAAGGEEAEQHLHQLSHVPLGLAPHAGPPPGRACSHFLFVLATGDFGILTEGMNGSAPSADPAAPGRSVPSIRSPLSAQLATSAWYMRCW